MGFFRTYRYKSLSLIFFGFMCCCYVPIFFRWRVGAMLWESLYIFPIGLCFGIILATQFMGLSAHTPKPQMATAISVYYLSQEVGNIAGVGISSAVLRMDFHHTLVRRLADSPDKYRVRDPLRDDFPLVRPRDLIVLGES